MMPLTVELSPMRPRVMVSALRGLPAGTTGTSAFASGGFDQRLGPLDSFPLARRVQRGPKVRPALRVQPEVRRVSEDSSENERGCGGYRTALVAEFVDVLPRDAHRLGECGLRKAQRLHELLDQDFTNTGRFSFGHQHINLKSSDWDPNTCLLLFRGQSPTGR